MRELSPPADPFQSVELPEIVEEYLEHGVARAVAFNPPGTLLAGKVLCILSLSTEVATWNVSPREQVVLRSWL